MRIYEKFQIVGEDPLLPLLSWLTQFADLTYQQQLESDRFSFLSDKFIVWIDSMQCSQSLYLVAPVGLLLLGMAISITLLQGVI